MVVFFFFLVLVGLRGETYGVLEWLVILVVVLGCLSLGGLV